MDLCVFDPSHGGYVSVESKSNNNPSISRTPSPATSNDDVFSIVSDASSQSSNGDSDVESYQAFERKVTCAESHSSATSKPVNSVISNAQHQHPRRSFSATKRPPPLARQEDRKLLFVNDLVDSATNMVSVIWPLSGSPAAKDANNRGVLPLRRYIEETLRRSRTSYSTLQVALYYLILIKPHVPGRDLTMEQTVDCGAMRAMQCGRRMFLAALILASKYLQDRNYSAKAWSKMSGLKTTEINSNERLFLSAVNWSLHVPENTFKRWSDIVLRFTAPPSPPLGAPFDSKSRWAQVIPLLTPDLDDPRIFGLDDLLAVPTPATTPAPETILATFPCIAISKANPLPAYHTPHFLEPRSEVLPPTPGLVRMGPLPTPQMTPSSVAASTPAASTCTSRRPSISMAMAQANLNLLCRVTSDRLSRTGIPQRSNSNRCPSVASSLGPLSPPESMISDATRSSRSSSISSISTSTSAPRAQRGQASSRCQSGSVLNTEAPSKLPAVIGSADCPITIIDDAEAELTSSPEPSQFAPANNNTKSISQTCESRKRCRSRPSSAAIDNHLQEEVRRLLASNRDAMDVDSDSISPAQTVHPCALRRAFANIRTACPFGAAKAMQPPASLRRESAVRIPISNEEGNKRLCSTASGAQEVYMEIKGGVWQGVA